MFNHYHFTKLPREQLYYISWFISCLPSEAFALVINCKLHTGFIDSVASPFSVLITHCNKLRRPAEVGTSCRELVQMNDCRRRQFLSGFCPTEDRRRPHAKSCGSFLCCCTNRKRVRFRCTNVRYTFRFDCKCSPEVDVEKFFSVFLGLPS